MSQIDIGLTQRTTEFKHQFMATKNGPPVVGLIFFFCRFSRRKQVQQGPRHRLADNAAWVVHSSSGEYQQHFHHRFDQESYGKVQKE